MEIKFKLILIILLTFFVNATKGQKIEKIHLEFSITNTSNTENVRIYSPGIKYNKKWIFSYTADDGPVGAYGKILQAVNKKWIDNEQFFHLDQTQTTGYVPTQTLGYTDGCGIEKRLPIGVSIWPNCGNSYNPYFMDKYKPNKYYPYITWEELVPIIDFGGSIYFHNMNEDKWSKNIPSEIISGLEEDQYKTFNKIGRKMKALMRPDGNNNYITAAESYNDIKLIFAEGSPATDLYPQEASNLEKAVGYRKISTDNLTKDSTWIAQIHNLAKPQWCHFFTHKPLQNTIDLLTNVNNLYGKNGLDDVWMASVDEVYEYWYMRKSLKISKNISNNILSIDLEVPIDSNFYHKDLSLIISGVRENLNSIRSSNNIYGLSTAYLGEDSMLVNINFNSLLLERAEKYTHLYELKKDEDSKNDALYFINQLTDERKATFLSRINGSSSNTQIDISSFTINNGIDNTTSQQVQITFNTTKQPTHYKIGETANLTNQEWVNYSSNTVKYKILSSDLGQKIIYLAVKDAEGYSNIYSAGIELKAPIPMPEEGIHLLICVNPEIDSNTNILYDTLENKVINLINPFKSEALLEEITGASYCKYINNLLIAQGSAGSNQSSYYALSNNGGTYPDKYINRCLFYTNYNQPDSILPNRLIFMLPNGSYKINLLGNSSNAGASNYKNLFYEINGILKSPTFSMQNNYTKYLTWDYVNVDNSYLILKYFSNPTRNNVAPINFIEIQSIGTVGNNNIYFDSNEQLEIITEKSSRSIKIIAPTNFKSQEIPIYNIAGEQIYNVMVKAGETKISGLSEGLYIINKMKICLE